MLLPRLHSVVLVFLLLGSYSRSQQLLDPSCWDLTDVSGRQSVMSCLSNTHTQTHTHKHLASSDKPSETVIFKKQPVQRLSIDNLKLQSWEILQLFTLLGVQIEPLCCVSVSDLHSVEIKNLWLRARVVCHLYLAESFSASCTNLLLSLLKNPSPAVGRAAVSSRLNHPSNYKTYKWFLLREPNQSIPERKKNVFLTHFQHLVHVCKKEKKYGAASFEHEKEIGWKHHWLITAKVMIIMCFYFEQFKKGWWSSTWLDHKRNRVEGFFHR